MCRLVHRLIPSRGPEVFLAALHDDTLVLLRGVGIRVSRSIIIDTGMHPKAGRAAEHDTVGAAIAKSRTTNTGINSLIRFTSSELGYINSGTGFRCLDDLERNISRSHTGRNHDIKLINTNQPLYQAGKSNLSGDSAELELDGRR